MPLGVYAAGERGLGDARDRDHVGSGPHVDLVLLLHLEHVVERLHHDFLEPIFTELPSTSKFLLGEYVLGKVPIASADGFIVPRSAILPEEDHYVLFTVKDGRAREHTVRVDLENEKDVEVIANDLHTGEPVVILGNYELKDGMAVKVDESR